MSTDDQNPLSRQPGGDHYHRLAYQPLEFAMENRLDPCAFSMLRYAARIGEEGKGQDLLDLEKILHYLDLRQYFRNLRLPGTEPRKEGLRIPMARFSGQAGINSASHLLLTLLGNYLENEAEAPRLRNQVENTIFTLKEEKAAAQAKASKRGKKSDGPSKAGS